MDVAFAEEGNESEPWKISATKPSKISGPMPVSLKLVLANHIYFEKTGLPQPLANRLIRLAAFKNLKQTIEQRLRRLLEQNPLRTDFQRHYEEIVAEYNREKERVTIEQTFEALFRFVNGLDEEESRAVREGLDEESLAIFDLLKKQDLSPSDIKWIKAVAVGLLERLKAEKLKVDHWRDKESTRDSVRIAIRDFLWSDETGLPVDAYDENEVHVKAEEVFVHVFRAYPSVPSPYYAVPAS